jgi:hypothetical protein
VSFVTVPQILYSGPSTITKSSTVVPRINLEGCSVGLLREAEGGKEEQDCGGRGFYIYISISHSNPNN